MFINYSLLPYILLGLTSIALLNTFGSIVSRKLNFNYGLLSPVSYIIYTLTGYLISKHNTLDIAVACNILIGMFDAIVGWNVSVKLKANIGGAEEQLIEITEGQRILMMAVIGSVFALIGYMLVNNITI